MSGSRSILPIPDRHKLRVSYRGIMIKCSRRLKVRFGQRVSRKDSDELGTVLEAKSPIKVKWDGGRTSYFDLSRPSDLRLYLHTS